MGGNFRGIHHLKGNPYLNGATTLFDTIANKCIVVFMHKSHLKIVLCSTTFFQECGNHSQWFAEWSKQCDI